VDGMERRKLKSREEALEGRTVELDKFIKDRN
jgi:hypothetical protein